MAKFKVKCNNCSRKVDIGSFTGNYVLHKNNSGEICPGAGRKIPKELIPFDKLRKPAKRFKKKNIPKETSGSLIAQFEINQKETIKRSLAEEREVKDAQKAEIGSLKSVSTVIGGLPTLGKKR